jgi:hypothetical protein
VIRRIHAWTVGEMKSQEADVREQTNAEDPLFKQLLPSGGRHDPLFVAEFIRVSKL